YSPRRELGRGIARHRACRAARSRTPGREAPHTAPRTRRDAGQRGRIGTVTADSHAPTTGNDASGSDSFPRLAARTARFTLGEPHALTVSDDGATVLFLRSRSGTDRTGMLWKYDVDAGAEHLLADPDRLLGEAGEDLS